MKKAIKNFLKKKNLYYPLKYSRLFHFYQVLFKHEEIEQQQKEVSFYESFLPQCNLIFDIGAYDGHKTEAFLVLSKKIVCCEPDEENFKVLKTRFRNKKNRVIIENKAISDKEGLAEFHVHHAASAFNTLSDKWAGLLERDNMEKWNEKIRFTQTQIIQTTTLDCLVDKYGIPDFIKIDVEGFEQWVLKGLSHRISFLSFETLLPDYANELQTCLSRIEHLSSFVTYNISLDEKLVLPEFVTQSELSKWLDDHKLTASFEIIVKMLK